MVGEVSSNRLGHIICVKKVIVSVCNLHFFRFDVTPALCSHDNTVQKCLICSSAVCETMTLSKYANANYHFTGDKMSSIVRWNALRALRNRKGMWENWYNRWCKTNAALSRSPCSSSTCHGHDYCPEWRYYRVSKCIDTLVHGGYRAGVAFCHNIKLPIFHAKFKWTIFLGSKQNWVGMFRFSRLNYLNFKRFLSFSCIKFSCFWLCLLPGEVHGLFFVLASIRSVIWRSRFFWILPLLLYSTCW